MTSVHASKPPVADGGLLIAGLILAAWTLAVGISLGWNVAREQRRALTQAQNDARANFNKDLAFRLWATSHGGVYVPPDERTPPNPNLKHIPERDVVTTTGIRLTLMNPAYMLRQMMDDFGELYGPKGRVTSLKPLNPANAPDDWEREALLAFERGTQEVLEVGALDGTPHVRLMRPMITREGCLKCHGHQGYTVGDVRGGVGVSISLAPYLAQRNELVRGLALSHVAIWLIGVGAIVVTSARRSRVAKERERGQEERRGLEAQQLALGDNLERSLNEIYVFDAETLRFIQVNIGARRNLGYTMEELRDLTPLDLKPEFTADSFAKLVEPLRTGAQQLVCFTTVHRRKDASLYPVEVHLQLGAYTGVRAFVAIILDISERRRAEEAVQRTQQLLQTVIDSMPDAVLLVDSSYRLLMTNQTARALAGVDNGGGDGMTCYAFSHRQTGPCSAAECRCPLQEVLATRKPTVVEHVHHAADGTERTVEILAAPVFDDDGNVVQVIESMRDITERRRAESERVLLATAAEQAAETIVITDTAGTIEYVNPAFEQTTGYTRAEAVGQNPRLLQSGQHDTAFYTDLWGTLARGETWQGCFTNKRKDGTLYQEEAVISPVRDESGTVVRYVGVKMDVTRRLALEARLQQAQKLESLGVLAGGIAHDFNNLLTAVLGGAELASMDLPPESPVRDHVDSIRRSALHAAELTKQMLAYSGQGQFVVEALDLGDLVRDMADLLEVTLPKGVALACNFAPGLPPIEGDAAQMRQVVMNLVINAGEAIQGPSGTVSVSTTLIVADEECLAEMYLAEDLRPGPYVCLAVADTGMGMDCETRNKIFEPFFTTKFQGRGLGLSAVLGIARGHGGALKVDSEPGHGTTFTLLLPTTAGHTRAPSAVETSLSDAGGATGTVLVVDDDANVRRVAEQLLGRIGFTVLTAEDGQAGVDVFRAHADEIRLVLLDMTMPRLDGPGAFREIRRNRPDACVILSSGYNEQEATNRFADKGLAGFVQKPYRYQSLMAAVRTALDT